MICNSINQQYYDLPSTNCGIQYQAPANNFNTSIFNNFNAFTRNNNYTTNNIFNTTNNFVSIRNSLSVNNYYGAPQTGLKSVQPGFAQRIGQFFGGCRPKQPVSPCQPKIPQKTGCGCGSQVKQRPQLWPKYGSFFQTCRGAYRGVADMFRSFMTYRFR